MKRRVLVVDDDPGTRQLLTELLAEFDVEVSTAGRDDEGLQRYLEVGPDLLFIDVLLPKQGGLSLLRKIRATRGGRDVPVFMMSALIRGADIRSEAVNDLGARDFLKKPFQFDVLRARLRELLEDRGETAREAITPFSPAEIITRGNLRGVDYPVLLKDLEFHDTTGCLSLRSGRVKKVLYFQDGAIAFAVSNQLRETLGRHLVATGQVDEELYRDGLEAMRERGIKMGEFLVERGALTEQQVAEAVRQNVLDKVCDVFLWTEGDFLLTAPQPPPAPLPGPPFVTRKVLWDGVRERFSFERVQRSLTPHQDLLCVPRGDLFEVAKEASVSKEDLQFLRLVRRLRGQPLRRVLAEVQGERDLRFLYYLLLRGFLTLVRDAGDSLAGLGAPDLERVRRARRRLDNARSRNYFQVLEVGLDANDEKVREAYLHKVKDVHPDMLSPGDPAELAQIHGELFQVIQAAYEALKTELRRREYLNFIQGRVEEEVVDGSKILEAESQFQHGRLALKRRRWAEAEQCFRRALELNPDESEYALNLGVALLRNAAAGSSEALEEAEQFLDRARILNPSAPEPYYQLGRLALIHGDTERARNHFQHTLGRSPNHVEALRELRLLQMRGDGKKGVLAGILKKGKS